MEGVFLSPSEKGCTDSICSLAVAWSSYSTAPKSPGTTNEPSSTQPWSPCLCWDEEGLFSEENVAQGSPGGSLFKLKKTKVTVC